MLVTAKQREKELTQAKTQLKKAQKHLLTVQRQHQSYRQQLEQAKQAVSQTQQEVESQEAALAQAKKQTAAQQRTLNQALERLSRLETASENTRQEEAQAEAAYQLAQQQFQQKEQALLTLLESRAANQKEMATLEEALTETQQKLVEAQQQAAVLAAEFAAAASLATQKDRAAGQLNAKLQTFATATEEVAADPLPAVSTELPPRPQRPPSQPAPTATAETASPAGSKPLAADEAATATSPRPERKPLSKLQPQETPAPSKSSKGKLLGSYLLCILAALALALLVRNFLFQVTQVSGASMEPTLHTEERLFTSKIAYWGSATPQRGDIVIVEDPSGLGEPPYVKRVIAIAGDHLVIREGQVYINDQLFVEPYLPADTETWGEVDTIIPAGCIFIMGDNRQESRDSRDPTISFVPVTKVAGKVLWVLYPFDEWGSVYETATASL